MERVTIVDAQTAANLAKQFDQRNTSGKRELGPIATARDVTNEKYSVNGVGEVVQHRREVGSASALPNGMVQLENGQVVSKQTALMNNWIRQEANGEITTIDPAFKANPEQVLQEQQEQQETDKTNQQFEASNKVLDDIEARTSAEQRVSVTNTFVADGDLDAAAKAIGASQSEMDALVGAYTENASAVCREMGLPDVGLMSYVMTDAELAAARKATLANDRQTLRQLADTAVRRLDDPKHNKAFVAALEEHPGVSVISANGTTVVSIPGMGQRSLRSLLREGLISRTSCQVAEC
jgi:hypothetical protein